MHEYELPQVRVVGALLRRVRTSLGLTLEDLAARVRAHGILLTVSTLSRAERGLAVLSPPALIAVADVLGISLSEIEEEVRRTQSERRAALRDLSLEEIQSRVKSAAMRLDLHEACELFVAMQQRTPRLADTGPSDEQGIRLWLWFATVFVKLYATSRARRYAWQILNASEASEDLRVMALVLLAESARMEDDRFGCTTFAKEIQARLDSVNERTRARGLKAIGACAVEEGEFEYAVDSLSRARKLYLQSDEPVEYVRATIELGYALSKGGQLSRGLRMIRTALAQVTRADHPDLFMFGRRILGFIAYNLGDRELGAECMRDAALLARAKSLPVTEFTAWFYMRELEQKHGDRSAAQKVECTLRRLLKKVNYRVPEVRTFLAQTAASRDVRDCRS